MRLQKGIWKYSPDIHAHTLVEITLAKHTNVQHLTLKNNQIGKIDLGGCGVPKLRRSDNLSEVLWHRHDLCNGIEIYDIVRRCFGVLLGVYGKTCNALKMNNLCGDVNKSVFF